MRLDLFLKVSRLCPRRAIAQKLCDAGLVSINGKPAKSAHAVKAEDQIVMRLRNRRLTLRVNSVPTARSVSKADAAELIQIISEEEVDENR
jgi:ribosomal 50S subunit-recycling heat shock protein